MSNRLGRWLRSWTLRTTRRRESARAVLHVNGKFLSQRTTGTQRYAFEVLRALSALNQVELVLHVPANADVPTAFSGLNLRRSRLRGVLFEQVSLPLHSRQQLLLNLAGPAPIVKRRQLVVIHDVVPFRHGESFSRTYRMWYATMYLILTRRAQHLGSVSQFSIGEIRALFRLPNSRSIELLPCGWQHIGRVDGGSGPTGRGYALLVGTDATYKMVWPTVRLLASEGIAVKVAGGQGARAVFGRTSEAPADDDLVERLGFVTDVELEALYRSATAFVFPSHYEGFGIPVLEAQALGCPLICSTSAALPEVAGLGAIFFSPGSMDSCVDAFARLRDDQDFRDLMVQRGYQNLQRFSWTATAERLSRLVG